MNDEISELRRELRDDLAALRKELHELRQLEWDHHHKHTYEIGKLRGVEERLAALEGRLKPQSPGSPPPLRN